MTKLDLCKEIKRLINYSSNDDRTDGEVLDEVYDLVDKEEKNELLKA